MDHWTSGIDNRTSCIFNGSSNILHSPYIQFCETWSLSHAPTDTFRGRWILYMDYTPLFVDHGACYEYEHILSHVINRLTKRLSDPAIGQLLKRGNDWAISLTDDLQKVNLLRRYFYSWSHPPLGHLPPLTSQFSKSEFSNLQFAQSQIPLSQISISHMTKPYISKAHI